MGCSSLWRFAPQPLHPNPLPMERGGYSLSGRGAVSRDRDAPLGAWYRFGSDEQANRNYRDPAWPLRYVKWRIAARSGRWET